MSENQEDRESTTPTEYNSHEDDGKSFIDQLKEEHPDGKEVHRDGATWWEYTGEDGNKTGFKLYNDWEAKGKAKPPDNQEKRVDPEDVAEIGHQLLLHAVKEFDSPEEQVIINKFKQSYNDHEKSEDKEREYENAKSELENLLDDKVDQGFAPKGSLWISRRATHIAQMDPEQRQRALEILED